MEIDNLHSSPTSYRRPPSTSTSDADYADFYTFSTSSFKKDLDDGDDPPVDYACLLPESFKPLQPVPLPPAASMVSSSSECAGCGVPIDDPVLLSVGTKQWHETCLRCSVCSLSLEGSKSCFLRDDSIFCKSCYSTQFTAKCAGCTRSISPNDWVRRARTNVYHIACFGCNQCKRQLSTGEEFALQENKLLCKQHYLELVEGESATTKQKTKRVRTTFTDEQIGVLQTHFQVDSNPDGADLERIAQLTGLSKRVTQVWFQNSRARQKKYNGNGRKTGGGVSDSLPSSEDALSPRSNASSEDCGMFPTSVTTSVEDTMITTNHAHLHKMEMMSMGLQAIDYD